MKCSRLLRPAHSAYRLIVPLFSKILAPTDFSDDSKNALVFAIEIAQKFGSEVIVEHVDQPLSPVMIGDLSPGLDMSTVNRIAEEQRLMALRELDQEIARLREA